MKVYPNYNVMCFDVDETLWDNDVNEGIEKNIERLKTAKKTGKLVVVWSQAGYEHAKDIVEALELSKFVDIVMTKPQIYVDDLNANAWMNWWKA